MTAARTAKPHLDLIEGMATVTRAGLVLGAGMADSANEPEPGALAGGAGAGPGEAVDAEIVPHPDDNEDLDRTETTPGRPTG